MDLFNQIGITEQNLKDTKSGAKVNSKDVYSWGMNPHFSAAQGESKYVATKSGQRTFISVRSTYGHYCLHKEWQHLRCSSR